MPIEGQKMPIEPDWVAHDWSECELPFSGEESPGMEFHCGTCGRVWCFSKSRAWFIKLGPDLLRARHIKQQIASTQVGGSHYQTGAHEPFLVIDEWQQGWPKDTAFYLGNALKYIARLGRKGDVEAWRQDLDKAVHYLQEAKKRLT